jgi:hypothetical protein
MNARLGESEPAPLGYLETKYITMFNMWKRLKLWPWQAGYSKEPCVEHINALMVMNHWYKDAAKMRQESQQQEPKFK